MKLICQRIETKNVEEFGIPVLCSVQPGPKIVESAILQGVQFHSWSSFKESLPPTK